MKQHKATTLDHAAIIEALRGLHATLRGSRDLYEEAAKRAAKGPIQTLFEEAASQRDDQSAELDAYLPPAGKSGEYAVSTLDWLRETWLKMRGLINPGNQYVLLIEAERAEDRIEQAYQELIETTGGSAVAPTLARQCVAIRVVHDRVRKLRDKEKASR